MANTRLTRTVGTPTLNTKYTFSFWVKRSKLTYSDAFMVDGRVDANNRFKIAFQVADKLEIWNSHSGSDTFAINTNRLFRDPAAWMHIVLAVDTTDGTAGDRVKLYINGTRETSFASSTNPSQNDANNVINESGAGIHIGDYSGGSNAFDGCMSHFHFCDGTALAATVFGETDSTTGEWKIKTSPSFTLGNNGFTILKDGSTITDQSTNSNDFSLASGTLTNTEDCPSNVFATFNPLSSNNPTLSGGSLIATASGGYRYALSTIAPTTGKYYAEFKLTTDSGYTNFGVENISKGSFFSQYNSNSYIGEYNSGVAYQPGSSSLYHNGSSSGSYGGAVSGDIIGIAMDLDNGFIYWSKNGTFLNSGVPTSAGTGTGGYAISNIANSSGGNTYAMGVSLANTGGGRSISANFGNGYFGTTAISSEGSNASGIGKFEYDVPAGYTALSTKGLNE